jgi:NlpC/P60 family protein
MRFHAKERLFIVLLYLAAVRPGLAQERAQEKEKDARTSTQGAERVTRKTPDLEEPPTVPRLLTPNEGLAILGTALDSRHHPSAFSSDCSHFVHALYESAGFHYEYASSSDLYEGTDEFRRVSTPQPGDLAVWRGHAGIVVNPAQHSFFSVLHSGPGVDSYDSPYWRQRGQPRFFRYLKQAPSGVLNSSIRTTSWQPAALNDAEPYESTSDGRISGMAGRPLNDVAASAKLAKSMPLDSEAFRIVILTSARPKPDQVSSAFLQACNDSEARLRGRDLFRSAESLVVFDHFEVKKVHISGNQGWIEIQLEELFSLTAGKAEIHKQSERQRWALRRDDKKSWKLTPSRNTIYLPQHTAERVLAHELAQLTEDTPGNASGTPEKANLARLLDVLFGN